MDDARRDSEAEQERRIRAETKAEILEDTLKKLRQGPGDRSGCQIRELFE